MGVVDEGDVAPRRDARLRVLVQNAVPTDMVSEAGPGAQQVLASAPRSGPRPIVSASAFTKKTSHAFPSGSVTQTLSCTA